MIPGDYTREDDVDPICGHHRRNRCKGCGTCEMCDGCYCGEDDFYRPPPEIPYYSETYDD